MSLRSRLWRRRRVVAVAAMGFAGSSTMSAVAASENDRPVNVVDQPDSGRCIVRLHGKSGRGGESFVENDVLNVLPDGNADGWGGRQWMYFPDEEYQAARAIVAAAIDASGCDHVIINGFSNGGAFAAKLYCRGETFGGRVLRFVVDDPVPDEGVLECEPAPDTELVLYWTGALTSTAQPGWSCSEADWTCEGGVTIGIDAYAHALGVEVRPSRFTDHEWYWDAPELGDWTRPQHQETVPGSSSPPTDE
jgi:pimeloyl-ACP methyl ester carboxylesterase